MEKYDHIIIGASKAGLSALEEIRRLRPDDSILLINEEEGPPYKRTHLTKKLAAGFRPEELALVPEGWYRENRAVLLNRSEAVSVDPQARSLRLKDGRSFLWGRLLLATGAEAARLPLPGIAHARHLRGIRETREIRQALLNSREVAVLGQGVEGIELAEQCALMGCRVSLTGLSSRLMERRLDRALSERLLTLFRDRGIRCFFGERARSIEAFREAGRERFRLVCGDRSIEADLILVSTGIRPRTELARPLGIAGEEGIRTDSYLETACPGIYAAGDALALPAEWNRGLWHSAEHQGRIAGRNMAGAREVVTDKPVRLKCEVFGDFYFSMGLSRLRGDEEPRGWEEGLFEDARGRYLKLFAREGRTVAGLMAGMKEGAKPLERGIREGRPPEELAALLKEGSSS